MAEDLLERTARIPQREKRLAWQYLRDDEQRKTRREDTMREVSRYAEFKKRALARPKVRAAFEEGLDVLRLAVSLAELREKRGLTQTQLAARLHTSPVISRIENGGNVELKTLQKIARALRARLQIELVEA